MSAGESLTDHERLDREPGVELDEELWRNCRVVMPAAEKKSIHLPVDGDVLDWFRSQGRGRLTRMDAILRTYYEAKRGDQRS